MLVPLRPSTCFVIATLLAFTGLCPILADDATPTPAVDSSPPASANATPAEVTVELPRVSLEVAQIRAQLIHDIYTATLDTMHHRYFHGDRAVVPARAMEDMFEELERQHHLQARWISASFSPMSIDHEPKSEFEKQAARKLAKGEAVVEMLEDGYYRRAGSIPLTSGCVSCHSGLFASASATPKFAGLIISVPVHKDAVLKAVATPEQP